LIHEANCALVLGAGGGIGSAMVAEFLSDPSITHVYAISRKDQSSFDNKISSSKDKLIWLKSSYSESAMENVARVLEVHSGKISRVCICHGVLHAGAMVPEKRFEDISENNLHEILQCNTIIPALWMKVLFRILKGKKDCVVSVLSARVGSIQDNHLGGWYSYRASKAALNMILKSLAIEYRRRAKNVKILAFHPGTTDTALSKPFQSSVASNKLFTPQFVAEKLSTIMDTIIIDGELSFLDWDGKLISW